MSINYNNQNTIIFTLARMNPPTPGHLYLIRRLINEAINKNIDHVYVILSKTTDSKNPITCQEKIDVLGENKNVLDSMVNSLKSEIIEETSNMNIDTDEKQNKIQKIENMNVISMCVPDIPRATPFTPIGQIVASMEDIPDINLFLIIGDDRAELLDSIADVFFFKRENVYSMNGIVLDRVDMETYKGFTKEQLENTDMKTVPVGAFSASFIRNIVKNGLKDKFMDIYRPYLSESKIENLYTSIENGLRLPESTKRESPPKKVKYNYPLIKDVGTVSFKKRRIEPTTLGGKRKTKRRKGRTYKKKSNRKTKRKLFNAYRKRT